MADFIVRLNGLGPTIKALMAIGGTPGLSLTVDQSGCPPYHAGYGFRDHHGPGKLPVTEDTIFPVGSLTKAVTAAAIGILVDDRRLRWDERVSGLLPMIESTHVDPSQSPGHSLTITDLLSDRAHAAWAVNSGMYANSYDLAGHVIERLHALTGES